MGQNVHEITSLLVIPVQSSPVFTDSRLSPTIGIGDFLSLLGVDSALPLKMSRCVLSGRPIIDWQCVKVGDNTRNTHAHCLCLAHACAICNSRCSFLWKKLRCEGQFSVQSLVVRS